MKGRSTAGDNPAKARRRKTATSKRGAASKGARGPVIADLPKELDRRTRELHEALDQQAATADVLRVISSSPSDLAPVLHTILANATRLCAANFGLLALYENGTFRRPDATYNIPEAFIALRRRQGDIDYGPKNPLTRLAATKEALHIVDVRLDEAFLDGNEAWVQLVELTKARSMLLLPMLKGSQLVGAIALYRQEVKPFTTKQHELVQSFAAQAVIAIENARLLNELRQSTDDLTKALEQQTATADVLRVISGSPGELERVFQTIVANATRLCEANFGNLSVFESNKYRCVATHNVPDAFLEYLRQEPLVSLGPQNALPRAATTKQAVHFYDYAAEVSDSPAVKLGGARSLVAVPLVNDNQVVGVIVIYRQEVRPFADKQIELVKNFAAQAVIAIENARLLNELRESLQQQTATADVLKVISRSAFELQTVLDTLVQSAASLCEADTAALARQDDGGAFHQIASFGYSPELNAFMARHPIPAGRGSISGRVIEDRKVVQITDLPNDPEYTFQRAVEVGALRTMLGVPLLRESNPIGVLVLSRKTVRLFTPKQIELVETFADQAVIAIENARLLNELRQRTTDLTESLEQQTATAEVLRVISSSPGELQLVFEAILDNAVRICASQNATLWLSEDGKICRAARHREVVGTSVPAYASGSSAVVRTIQTKQTVHLHDYKDQQAYRDGDDFVVTAVNQIGVRTYLGVPMLKEGQAIGAISVYRTEVRPFTEKQIELVQNFAAQAVIAIENARLLNELRQRTAELGRSVGELRALGEVSQAVNSTLDLQTVLETIVAKAAQLAGTETGAIYVFDDIRREFQLRATYGMDRELIEALTHQRIGLDEPNVEAAMSAVAPIQVTDLKDVGGASQINDITLRAGYRARLVAPLLRGSEIVGMLVVRRRAPGAFAQSTIDLMKTFAAQSTVAIENARLFHNVEASLEELRTAQDRLVQTQKLASLGQLTAGIAHEIKNPLNFVNNFSGVSAELLDELRAALGGVQADDAVRSEITELADTLRDNLTKIVQHGRRADSIVKNMLLHSREGSGQHRPVDINGVVEEAVNLAYHGARAEKQGFNITLERSLDPAAGEIDCFPQEITRVLLNLISNGFYAATRRKEQGADDSFAPTLTATTKSLGDRVEIKIRDNGTGIPTDVRDKIFNPFFTTKPAGEGTGLGLSISHDIIVKQHAGIMEVDSKPGKFTEFRIVLQRAAKLPTK